VENSTILSARSLASHAVVIVVNFNGASTLTRCLESIQKQTVKPGRVIVVDNGSLDGSALVAEPLFPAYEFVHLADNKGFAYANNLAARMATDCEWLALLNPDAFAAPDWLYALCQAVEDNRAFRFFGSRMLMDGDPTRFDGIGDVYHISGLAWRAGHGRPVSGFDDSVSEIFSPCAAAALYRRDDFMSLQGFDEDFFCYMEDVDLGFRLRLAGARCLYVPKAIVRHQGSTTSGGRHGDFAVYYGHRNMVWVFVKNMPARLLFWLLPLHLMANMAAVLWFAMRGQESVICRAKLDAIRGLPRMLAKRREIQKSRKLSGFATWQLMNKKFGFRD